MKKGVISAVLRLFFLVLLFTGCATVDQKSWEKARQMDSFESYGDYIKSNPLGAHVGEARAKIAKSYTLDDHEVEQLARLQKDNPIEAKRALYVDKLIFTAAACLDMQANWVYPVKGRKLYDMLKKYDSQTLGDSMTRVVLIHIDRLRVLFLIVKLGISGTQSTLNSLLMRYGDKGMAEDFLNSGSGELHSGGSDWARAHGYRIRSGPGSHRVGWGRF